MSSMPDNSPGPSDATADDPIEGASGFGSTIGWTIIGTILPGLGLIRAGRRVLGGAILGIFVIAIGGTAALAAMNLRSATAAALDPTVLYSAAAALIGLALAWTVVITATHLSLRQPATSTVQRVSGGVLVGVLSFAVAAPLALGANVAFISAAGVSTIFGGDPGTPTVDAQDPWNGKSRLNVLILGGDSGVRSHRSAATGARTDTVIVASIDTQTGATTLITLPRNATKMPFPADSPLRKYYPNGFTNTANILDPEYLLNAMYRNVPAQVPNNLLGKTKDFGAKAMMTSVGQALGLDINYYVFVNMDGFKDFVNAVGGITVNVNYRIPVGGHNASGNQPAQAPEEWIEVGPNKHLTGGYALWYARGRYQLDDYSRMERQRCVISAIATQADPANLLRNYQGVMATGEKNITTNIPRTLLPALAELGLKTRDTKMRSLVFDPSNGFYSWKPNWTKVRSQVKKALAETATTPTSESAQPSTSPGATPSPAKSATSKPKSDDLTDACAYHPHSYKKK